MVSDIKKVLTSALFIIKMGYDVIVTSRDVIRSNVEFYGLKLFVLIITNSSPSV